ncbi:MAG: cytochrome c [Magnetococcales bacterium]|nr:cytochrome c [Magnetococcales bacterium]
MIRAPRSRQPAAARGGRRWVGFGVVLLLATGALPAAAGDIFHGKALYEQHCARCHGENGRGKLPGTPDFTWRGGPANGLQQPDIRLRERLQGGSGTCPAFRGVMSDMDLLDVITHLRSFH